MEADRKKYARLSLRCDALQAAAGGLNEAVRNADDRARATKYEAFRNLPFKAIDTETLAEVAGRLRAENERIVADERSHPDNGKRVRAALVAVQLALDAAEHAGGLRAERERLQAELAPLGQLLTACRRFLGEDAASLPVLVESR